MKSKTKKAKKVYVLYGVAERGDLVCMFFATKKDRREFTGDWLPGRYNKMTLVGIDYDKFEVK